MSTRSGLSLSALLSLASIAVAAPCDSYASGRTPCVAAHSTTRALFDSYSGPLYQVMRTSDSATTNIKPMGAGGVANSAAQDKFCRNADCVITVIYDQTANNNDLTPAPPGGAASGPGPNGYDLPSNASAAPVYLDGHKVYGVYIEPGYGYRNDDTVGVAINNEPEGIYDVVDGTRYNGECCFDYGNAETNVDDNGDAHMEAVYFGLGTFGGTGAGSGPWVLADLENGLYSKGGGGVNANEPTVNDRFVTAMVKGARANHWEISVGNAQAGKLDVVYSGPRPSGYYPMRKEGAIILGIGGDNSNSAIGTFYEGAMTAGFPSGKTDNRVQANIVAAGYSDTA